MKYWRYGNVKPAHGYSHNKMISGKLLPLPSQQQPDHIMTHNLLYKASKGTLRLSVTPITTTALTQCTTSALERYWGMYCTYTPCSAQLTDLVSTSSNLLEAWCVAVFEIPTGWCPAVFITIQDLVVDKISLSLSLHTLHHAVKDGQYCLLSRKREGIAEFQARVWWSTTVYVGKECKVLSTTHYNRRDSKLFYKHSNCISLLYCGIHSKCKLPRCARWIQRMHVHSNIGKEPKVH